jgi:aspartyl-tRNA(Asn)/glutamyl-tRNA(Gln) amidotransferase subunit A
MDTPVAKMLPQTLDRRDFLFSTLSMLAALSTRPIWSFAEQTSGNDLTRLTLQQASSLVQRREVSPVALTEACLARIEKYDRQLNAFITVTSDLARAQARALEDEINRGSWRGPLHGIPLALKDNIDTAGVRTTAASAIFADRTPTEDAEVVRRLKAAGAVLLGKLNMHEFAWGGTSVISYWGPVHNPWSLERETGGSSGGSAAAVAADLCFGSLGTDTGGSIRVPSAHCGVVGLKPTYGRVSNRGVIPLVWSLDHVGPICKTVGDAALIFQAIAGYDPADLSSVDAPLQDYVSALSQRVDEIRLGVPHALFYDVLDSEIRSTVEAALETLRPMVKVVRDVTLPPVLDLADVGDAEVYAYHRPLLARAEWLYQPATRKGVKSTGTMSGADYVLARRALEERRREVVRVFTEVDLLVTPTVKYAPRTIKECMEREETEKPLPPEVWNTWLFNIFGLPAISIPCGFTKSGLPIGLQIAGAPFAEAKVLALAQAYEQITKWHLRRPTLVEAGGGKR